jgi:hypothetical protein
MKLPVSEQQNKWFDARNVDDSDLNLEQEYNNNIQASIINNHFGSGVILDTLEDKILFNSDAISGFLDGKVLDVQFQPTDINFGNQLEVEVKDTLVAGKKTIKILIVGLDFNNNLQYDRFIFHNNEKQISSKHYKLILGIILNDFIGSESQSFNLKGERGQILVKEAVPFFLSRESLTVSQNIQPNIFFRDLFFESPTSTLKSVLELALPTYNIDNLDIRTDYKQLRGISEDDVSTQIGQKFRAKTNNIQKINLLMSVSNSLNEFDLVWTGDLLISLYPLQSTVSCPTDITPDLAIDFDPTNVPLVQLSINYSTLLDKGIVLNTVPQPVPFVFSNTNVGNGSAIVADNFYVITIKRAGAADKCVINLATGNNSDEDARLSIFNGNIWVDVPEESCWFEVWSDAAKVSDGQAYDQGHGIIITKTKENDSGTTVDYSFNNVPFLNQSEYFAIVQATTEESTLIQDERTGNNVFSRKQFVPDVKLVKSTELSELEENSDPLVIGVIADKNVKNYNQSTATITSKFHSFGMIGNEIIIKIIDDPSDTSRFDLTVLNLITEFINGNLNNAKIIANSINPSTYYRIAKSELITVLYGDLNNDGVVDEKDLREMQLLIGANLNTAPTSSEYFTLINPFVDESGVNFQLLDENLVVIGSGTGDVAVNILDGSRATFTSSSVDFSSVSNLSGCTLVISGATNAEDNGSFKITGLVSSMEINIIKSYYTPDTIIKIMQSDITNDLIVDSTDESIIIDYINKFDIPNTSSPNNRIGTSFRVLKLVLEQFVDRNDEYSSLVSNRSTALHPTPDVFLADSSFYSRDFMNNPVEFSVVKQLNWEDYFIFCHSDSKKVPVDFETSGFLPKECELEGKSIETQPIRSDFDKGLNNFFIGDNLILGGQILNKDGYVWSNDYEVHTVVFEMPEDNFQNELSINFFTNFIAENSGGKTRLGYEAARFGSCRFVQSDALEKNQVRFNVSIQSYYADLDGYDGYNFGIVVNDRIGVAIDYSTGLLYLNMTNLNSDPVLRTLKTKIQVQTYLKEAGFVNKNLSISAEQTKNIFNIQ